MNITALALTLYLSNPLLTIAQGKVESHLNVFAKGRAKEQGAFQVIERHWGPTPKDFLSQARQCESIRASLSADIWQSVKRYNGKGKRARAYLARVQKQVIQDALL